MEPPFTLSRKGFKKDYYAGAAMIIIGLGVAVQGSTYAIGSLERMGPGFFPTALGVVLVLLGVAIAMSAVNGAEQSGAGTTPTTNASANNLAQPQSASLAEARARPEWRGWFCITAGIVLFIVLGQYGGLLPATFAVVFISAMGDRQNSWRQAFVLAVAMVLICLIVFHWALKVQFPLFQWGS